MSKKRWLWISTWVLLLLAPSARADVSDDVHRLLVAERFSEADARANAELGAAQGDSAEAIARRLRALNLLIDCARAQRKLTLARTGDWIEQAAALAPSIYGENDRARAKQLALAGERDFDPTHGETQRAHGVALIGQAADLLEHGSGTVSSIDQSYVYDALAWVSLDSIKYNDGLIAAQRAETLLRHARTGWEQQRHARLLALLGLFQMLVGQGTPALANAKAGAALAERVAGPNSLAFAEALSFLGQVQMYRGDLVGVITSLQRVVSIQRMHYWLPAGSTDRSTNSIAYAMTAVGDYDHARPLYEEVIAHNEVDANGHFEELLPDSLNTLASLEKATGNVDRARHLYERALALEDQLHGTSHPLFLEKPLINLGNIALQQGDVAVAEGYFQRAAALDATDGSGVLTNYITDGRANLALAQGRPDEAESLLGESIDRLQRRYGKQHPELVMRMCHLAVAKARLGKTEEAYALAEAAERLRIELLQRIAPALNNDQVLNLKKQLITCSGPLLDLAARTQDAEQVLRAWQLVADSRGLATRLLARRLATARGAADAGGKQRWARWERAAHDYADALLRDASQSDELRAAGEALAKAEANLGQPALLAAGLRSALPLRQALDHRPVDSVVVAYARVEHFDLDANARGEKAAGYRLYALISDGDSARLMDLGDSAAIDAAIDRWVRLLREPDSNMTELAHAGDAVRAAVWDALAIRHVPTRILVVPDGSLFRVNFAALPDGDGYLVEAGWHMHTLDSEQDLALARAAPAARLVLVGSPDFGPLAVRDDAVENAACATQFSPLPGTTVEINRLAHLWHEAMVEEPRVLTGRSANKKNLRLAGAHADVIHIATHAVDLNDSCTNSLPSTRGVSVQASTTGGARLMPMAALALAGANHSLGQHDVNGILTSEEVVAMPLERAQWVVLAACDTGIGEVVPGEGIFGLRRAFRLAGARTVVMSLWKVADGPTADWMEALYRSHFQQHLDTADAVARAELTMLSERRTRGESTHPFYWAGFLAAGDWH